jgi:inosine-uridine nucleoside N-ribohydrolase
VHTRSLSAALSIALLAAASFSPRATATERIRVILDTDANNELDDQHAIAHLLFNSHLFDVEGITVNRTRAGGGIERHHAEAARIVELCGMSGRFPLRRGASGSFEQIRGELGRPGFDGQDAVDLILARARARDPRPLVLLPIGKLTNVALALAKDPAIAAKLRVSWLGSNYPEPGEYNQTNDEAALSYLLETGVPFEIVSVRYGTPVTLPAPKLENGKWVDRPTNPRRIVVWENFDRAAILKDFYASVANPR